jgi:hypothetical protein
MNDRRAHLRVPCLTTVREYGRGLPIESRATNLCEGGLYLQRFTDEPLCPGENLYLELQLPDGPVEVVGRVVKAARELFHEAGAVTFTAISRVDESRIRHYVTERRRVRSPVARIVPVPG